MEGHFFADQAVKFSQVPAFRAEHFPYAGPYPWLDRPDALDVHQFPHDDIAVAGPATASLGLFFG